VIRREDKVAPTIGDAQLTELPAVVRHYLRAAGVIGKEPIRTAHLRQTGAMRLRPGGRWLPMTAEQTCTTDPPSFTWHGTIHPFPLVSISGTDTLQDGGGQLRIALFGRIPLASDHGAEVLQADVLRYLSEIVWFPTAALSEAITWYEIDAVSARAALTCYGTTVSATFQFNTAGEPTRITAERFMKDGKRNVLVPWTGRVGEYREMHGIRIPTTCEIAWQLASGEFAYFRCTITAASYNAPLPPA
jgi:hypothetical protein